jgi:hypothetical protein
MMHDAILLKGWRNLSRRAVLPTLTLAAAAALVAGCQSTSFGDATSTAGTGETYYTQFSLFQEKFRHLATNYRRGILVPANTKVTLVGKSRDTIRVRDESGAVLTIVNVPNFTGADVEGVFNRTFSATPVDLSQFTELEQRNIRNGTVAMGMTKDAVIKALGYPPKHETPSLESNQWRYWAHRFRTYIVSFQDGKVVKVDPPHQTESNDAKSRYRYTARHSKREVRWV